MSDTSGSASTREQRGDGDAESEREPDGLRAEPPRGLLLPRSSCARDLRSRPVLEEVEDREGAAENREGDPERSELGPTEMPDDRRVDEEVEGLRRQRAERRQREPEDLAVVPRPQSHKHVSRSRRRGDIYVAYAEAAMVASYAAT